MPIIQAHNQLILKIPFHIYLDHLSMQLGITPQTQGFLKDWTNHFFDHWCHTNQLKILSFRNSWGVVLNYTSTADPRVLKPVADGPVADCHPANVALVQVSHTYYFEVLDPEEPISPLHLKYFIQLPQETHEITNINGVMRNLATFHGDGWEWPTKNEIFSDDLNCHAK